jgi:hypothetical protein
MSDQVARATQKSQGQTLPPSSPLSFDRRFRRRHLMYSSFVIQCFVPHDIGQSLLKFGGPRSFRLSAAGDNE